MCFLVIPNFKHPNVSLIGEIFIYDIHVAFRKFANKTCRLIENLNNFVTPANLRYKSSCHCIHIDTYK